MEQAELRQWEAKCIQEEAPWCIAACPLHVDVRTFCSLVAQRRFDKAWAVLAKTMPLPGVLARLCDGACKADCRRKDAGGAIEMDALERFCADVAKPVAPPRPLPSRHKSVAVAGAELTGLCAAWEMARRGFDVTLHCAVLGGALRELPADVLPEGALDRELKSLERLGVTVNVDPELAAGLPEGLLDEFLERNDAVFLDGDAFPGAFAQLGEPDEVTLGTRQVGVFAFRAGEPSAILRAAGGRRAANSIERFTQGVSMVSGREQEGPYPTRLFTSLDGVDPQPSAIGTEPPTEVSARDEGRRCLQCECLECLKGCGYLRHYKAYPKVYARRIYNNASIVMGTRQANKMINSCMLCGQCEVVCPEDFAMADLCLQARRDLVAKGHMPPSAHEFALRDMAFANGGKCVLARHAPGHSDSEYLFFPGCQLTASDPAAVSAAYADLRDRLGGVGLLLHCCGAPAQWAGRQDLETASNDALKGAWEELGSPRIIAACPTCQKQLRQVLPDAEIVSHWSVLRAMGLPEGARNSGENVALGVSDPCAARHDIVLREDVRQLLHDLRVETVEPEYNGETAPCCGYGGLLSEANPELGKAVAEDRAAALDEDWVTYCVMCRDMIARTGKRALHLYDLLYPSGDDPAARPAPGYSARRENRVRLREQLLAELWNEQGGAQAEPYESFEVAFTDDAARTMEERRILVSDVRKVLLQARESGRHLIHGETGRRLASFRPVVVTYWVEYEERGGGYVVHNAWCHRMHIKKGQP